MNLRMLLTLTVALMSTTTPLSGSQEGTAQAVPGPYVNVYHDQRVTFQVRRDRIKSVGEEVYRVWLRWLWAEPQPWKASRETARIAITILDCGNLRLRELAVLHKDDQGKVFDSEERAEDEVAWKSFPPETGASAAMRKLCEFLPELASKAKAPGERKE